MKYIVEVLQPSNSGGLRTQAYSNRKAAIDALDNYKYHRPGQPVVVLYNENGEKKGLLAIGTGTNLKDYYILTGGDEIVNNYFTKIDASNVLVQPIDITNLLNAHGPGYDFEEAGDPSAIYQSAGCDRHFGWLGTTAADWAVTNETSHWRTNLLTVQEMFDAILHGTKINRSGVAPEVKIELFDPISNQWVNHLTITYNEGDTKQFIRVRLTVLNILDLDNRVDYDLSPEYAPFNNLSDKFTYFKGGPYEYETDAWDENTLGYQPFDFVATHPLYGTGTSQAVLEVRSEDQEQPTEKVVTTNSARKTTASEQGYSAILDGSSNWNTAGKSRGIKYRVQGDTEWKDDAIAEPGSTSMIWSVRVNSCVYGQVYEYYAYVIDDNNVEVFGQTKTFKFTQEQTEYTFKYKVQPVNSGSITVDMEHNGNVTHPASGTSFIIDEYDWNWTVNSSANTGYRFSRYDVSVEGTTTPSNVNPLTGRLLGNTIVTAVFESETPSEFTLTVAAGTNGSVSPNDYANGVQVPAGQLPSITQFTATPNINYVFDCWKLNGTTISSGSTLTINSPINQNSTYIALFKLKSYVITFKTDQQEISTNPSSKNLNHGTTGESFPTRLTGTGASNWEIDYWYNENTPGTHISTNQYIPTVTGTATYVAHLKAAPVEEYIQYQHTYRGTDLGWNNVYTSIQGLCTSTEINGQNYWLYNDYSDRPETGFDFFIPVKKSGALLITSIDTKGKSFELYTWSGSEWQSTSLASVFTSKGNNIYEYTPAQSKQDIFAIKLSNS